MRKEVKYRIPLTSFFQNKKSLQAILQEDVHNGIEGYSVRSLYFDSIDDGDLADKLNGLHHRKKIRLRIYDVESTHAKLEWKEKIGSLQRKQHLLLEKADAERLIEGDYQVLLKDPSPLAKRIYGEMIKGVYRPKCIIEYQRLAFISPTNDIRLTFDRRLQGTEANFALFSKDLPMVPLAPEDQVIFEVKYQHFLLSYIRDAIHLFDRSETSISKYCLGRAISY